MAARKTKKQVVIVESPAKARTIEKYLGKGYTVESSIGHIRDLPSSAAQIPKEYKKEPWARLGVNIDADFEPLYVVDPKKNRSSAPRSRVPSTMRSLRRAEAVSRITRAGLPSSTIVSSRKNGRLSWVTCPRRRSSRTACAAARHGRVRSCA